VLWVGCDAGQKDNFGRLSIVAPGRSSATSTPANLSSEESNFDVRLHYPSTR
jgi:hypothetical protein